MCGIQRADTHDYVVTAQKELDRVAQISKKTLAFYRESTNAAPVDLCGLVKEVDGYLFRPAGAQEHGRCGWNLTASASRKDWRGSCGR